MDFHQTIMCIDIVETWFGIANGQISSNFNGVLTELSARETPEFSFPDNNLSKFQGILTKLGTCIDIKEIWFGIANGQILSIFDRVICPRHDNARIVWFEFFIWLEKAPYQEQLSLSSQLG